MVTFYRKNGGRVTVSPVFAKTPGDALTRAWVELATRGYPVSKMEKEVNAIRVTTFGAKGIVG